MKKIIVIFLTTVLLFATSCKFSGISNVIPGSNKPVQQFLDEVDQNNVSDAKKIYKDEIDSKPELEEKVEDELFLRLDNAISDYNAGIISDNEATVIFDTITALKVLDLSDITPLRNELNNLISSKSAFNSAETMFNSEDYYNAYQQYILVIADDTNYSSAVSKASIASERYVENVNEQVESFKKANDYVSAIEAVNNAVELLPNNQTLQTSQTTLKAEYLQYALDTASSTHKNGNNYMDAIKIIKEAQTVLDDSSLSEALLYYQSFMPVDLFSIERYYYDESTYCVRTYEWMPGDVDIYGKTHGHGQRIVAWESEKTVDEYYNISSYNVLTGSIVPGPQFEIHVPSEDVYEDMSAVVYIYGDNELLYTSPQIRCDSQQEDFSIDITGVSQIRIYVVINGYYGSYGHNTEIGLVDFILQKTL